MGSYLNPAPVGFRRSLNSEIYVDKSGLIAQTNRALNTQSNCLCVSRPRRFGKSMAVDMLAAYYAFGQDTHALFAGLKIAADPGYETHINQYNVLRINMQEFLSKTHDVEKMLQKLCRYLITELRDAHPDVLYLDEEDLVQVQLDIFSRTGRLFVILIDEWDCLFREFSRDTEAQKKYLDFLRLWLKDQPYVGLAYMTGILPIKKYGTHSALNMFLEISMTSPRDLAPFFGFTDQEVRALCDEYAMSYEEARAWYDGYELTERTGLREEVIYSMYSPRSMVEAMLSHTYGPYWNRTETYEALKVYIRMNMDGLKDAVVKMLAGEEVEIDPNGFANDMTTFANRDDVLALLIHLGYLSYHAERKTVTIPNKEVAQEYVTSITRIESYGEVARAVTDSKKLLEALWAMDGAAVAEGIDRAHNEIAILRYNNENALSCAIHLAFFYAREYYNIYRELPAGKGFADIVFVPRKLFADKPAAVIELKWDRDAEGAIAQIKAKKYCAALKDYHGDLLLCGINYDRTTKTHTCLIEKAPPA